MISSSDFVFVYSGGSNNSDPALSLGGQPSAIPIPSNINNLFDDISKEEAASGFVDYRCFYIFNDSLDYGLYNTDIFIGEQEEDGAYAELGFAFRNDRQVVSVTGPAMSGSVILAYDNYTITVAFLPDKDKFAQNLQNALNGLPQLSEVRCTGINDDGAITVFIDFEGYDGNRYHPLVVLIANNIDGSTGITIYKEIDGSPVNAISPAVVATTQSPNGVTFGSVESRFYIGNILPGDGIPIWARRTTPEKAGGVRYDGFLVQLAGSPEAPDFPQPPPTWSYTMEGGITLSGASNAIQEDAGIYHAIATGGMIVSGESSYTLNHSSGGVSHFITAGSGGVKIAGDSIERITKKRFIARPSGGIVVSGAATASTDGVENVPPPEIDYSCSQFPISWTLSSSGVLRSGASPELCGCQYIIGASRLDFNPTTGTWIGPFGASLADGGTITSYYYELSYNEILHEWNIKSHSPYNPTLGNTNDCSVVNYSWTSVNWNCCGVNNLSNSKPISFFPTCGLDFYSFSLTPYGYCNPTPYQIDCGKCARETKVPNTITLHTQFEPGSTCQSSPLAGTFTLQRFTAKQPCYWLANIPSLPGVSWVMYYAEFYHEWYITIYDPSNVYGMRWYVSDSDFNCCTPTTNWTLSVPDTFPCSPGVGSIATTTPVEPTGCA